jgi:hypothetical protein
MPARGKGFYTFVADSRLHGRMARVLRAFGGPDRPCPRFGIVSALYPEAASSVAEADKCKHNSERIIQSAMRNGFIRKLAIKTNTTRPLTKESDHRRIKESLYVLCPGGERYLAMYDKYMRSLSSERRPKLYERGPNYERNLRKVNMRRLRKSRRDRGLED